MERFLTTTFNATMLPKKSIHVTWYLRAIFNATITAAACCITLTNFDLASNPHYIVEIAVQLIRVKV